MMELRPFEYTGDDGDKLSGVSIELQVEDVIRSETGIGIRGVPTSRLLLDWQTARMLWGRLGDAIQEEDDGHNPDSG